MPVHEFVWVHVHMCVYTLRPDTNIRYLPQLFSTLFWETEFLTAVRTHWLFRLASQQLLKRPLSSFSTRITDVCHHAQPVFYVGLEVLKSGVSMLAWLVFYQMTNPCSSFFFQCCIYNCTCPCWNHFICILYYLLCYFFSSDSIDFYKWFSYLFDDSHIIQ